MPGHKGPLTLPARRIFAQLRRSLRGQGDAQTRDVSRGFFKEQIKTYGVKTPAVRQLGKAIFRNLPDQSKDEVFKLCETLWQSGYLEEAVIACQWSLVVRRAYAPEDFSVFMRWLETYVTNWAACDTLCNHTVGEFLEKFPEFVARLLEWTQSSNRWVRRGAAVSLILPARKGLFLDQVFRIADRLLTDGDDLVQKGYGWMLKAASESDPRAVLEYVLHHKADMPRTALRYAIEKLSPQQRALAMVR